MKGRAAERLVWLFVEQKEDTVSAIHTIASTNVVGLPCFVENNKKLSSIHARRSQSVESTNSGFLPNGERYVVYRVALYGDGFAQNASSAYSKSVAGVYMLPLGLPVSERTSAHAVRVLCLTPLASVCATS